MRHKSGLVLEQQKSDISNKRLTMAQNPDEYPTAHTELKSGLKFTCVRWENNKFWGPQILIE